MDYILLTDAQQRKTLAVARSLGKRGLHIMTAEETRYTPASFSRYCSKHLISPNPQKEPEAYYCWLKKTLERYPVQTLFPMDDATLRIVMEHRGELEKYCRILLPPAEAYTIAADKGLSVLAAQKAGLACPQTEQVQNVAEVTEIAQRIKYPVVIKPRKSSGGRGIRVVRNKEELERVYLEIHRAYPYPLIQEYITPGERYDVCLLFDREQTLRASFVQKEIRHFPLENGPSTVQESVYFPELVDSAASLVKDLNWCGIVEVEFMLVVNDGKMKFMEINPRFWNSLHMAILAGVDFPWLLYQLCMDRHIENVFTYRTGVKCRWLLPGDILHFLFNSKRFDMDPPFFRGVRQNVYDDIISHSDPFPTVGFLFASLRYVFNREMWKDFLKR